MCHVHSPRRGRRDAQGRVSRAFGAGCTSLAWRDPTSYGNDGQNQGRCASPRKGARADRPEHRPYQGRCGSRFGHLDIEDIRTNPRDGPSRGFFVVRRLASAGVKSFPRCIVQQRTDACSNGVAAFSRCPCRPVIDDRNWLKIEQCLSISSAYQDERADHVVP